LDFSGKNSVTVGVTTLLMIVPIGVSVVTISFCFQLSDPGANTGPKIDRLRTGAADKRSADKNTNS
jgi:hypothetical protein